MGPSWTWWFNGLIMGFIFCFQWMVGVGPFLPFLCRPPPLSSPSPLRCLPFTSATGVDPGKDFLFFFTPRIHTLVPATGVYCTLLYIPSCSCFCTLFSWVSNKLVAIVVFVSSYVGVADYLLFVFIIRLLRNCDFFVWLMGFLFLVFWLLSRWLFPSWVVNLVLVN